jgi:alanine dehydrogenase
MKPGSVILDVSIDQGGCVETSRPTSPDHSTFKVHGVTHYCVPNMTTNAPRAASRALALAALSHLIHLAEDGVEHALRADPGLARGAYLHRGAVVNEILAAALGLPARRLTDLFS